MLVGRRGSTPRSGDDGASIASAAEGSSSEPEGQAIGTGAKVAGWAYVLLGIAFAVSITLTISRYPLFPFKPNDAAWSFAWLLQTIWDYYATAICLCGVVIATDGWGKGSLWSAGILLLGSSFSCAWVALRLLRHGTLALRPAPRAP